MTNTTLHHSDWADVRPADRERTLRGLLHRWPTLAGIAMAVFVALDISGGPGGITAEGLSSDGGLAPVLAASGFVYLGAAALRKRATTWPMFFGAFAVITATEVIESNVDATWVLLGLAVLFAGYGLLRGAARPAEGLPLQMIAMAGFGSIAAAALLVGGDVGAYLVAAGLLGHAAWDVWHHRANRVVTRSLAEFCVVLDTLVAVALVIVAVRG